MFAFLGRASYRFRWWVVGCWLILFCVALPFLPRVPEQLNVGGFSSPQTEAARARKVLERELNLSPSTLVVIVQSERLDARSAEFGTQLRALLAAIDSVPNVTETILPRDDANLIADDGRTAYALVGLSLPPEEAQRQVAAFRAALRAQPDLTYLVAGGPAFFADIETVSQRDLRRAELIAFPFALIALLLVFGTVVAAVVPLIVGGIGVAVILLTLYFVAQTIDLSIFVLNLASMLGLGLAVDYSLFITSRFREELPDLGGNVAAAVEKSLVTAGRAVFFSGLTVLIGLLGLTRFEFMFLRSIGISGVVVVLFSTLAALTLLPALLGILGGRIECLRLRRRNVSSVRSRDTGFWSILAGWVMARPFLVLIPTLGVLLGLGTPFLRVNLSSPDATILPTDLPSRQGFDILTEAFGPGEISPLVIAVQSPSSIYTAENLRALYDLERWLMRDPRINRTRSVVSAGPQIGRESISRFVAVQRGIGVLGVDTGLERFASDRGALILAFTFFLPNDPESKALLRDVRAYELGGDLTMLVDGSTAEIVDVVDAMYADVPATIALIVGTTYLLLLVLFRSVLLPLKAILMNALSIVASYGALVFIFQDGHFSDVLQFAPLGFVEASLPVIMFCVLFGLSMDYEVFLLTRIREEWERTGDNTHSVAVGLQRSGQIITSAALVVVVVTASFVSAQVILIKALGLGIALAVLLDATIVRALLVPATMRLLGRWNWWFPTRLGRVEPGGDISSSAID